MSAHAIIFRQQALHRRHPFAFLFPVTLWCANNQMGEGDIKFRAITAVVGFASLAIFTVLAIYTPDDAPAAQLFDVALAAVGFIGGALAWLRISKGNC